jgi:hypothetical protein
MAGLVRAILIGKTLRIRNRDARTKPAHDATVDYFVALLFRNDDGYQCVMYCSPAE